MRRALRDLTCVAACVLACAAITGCAAPGEPTPPRQVIPTAIADLAVRQSGNTVVLTFTLPKESTDREALAEPPAIEIYRAALSPGSAPDRNTVWRLVDLIPSEQVDSYKKGDQLEFRDPLAAEDLARAAGSPLAYKIRTRASKRRASDDSNVVTTPIYPAPGAPADLHVSVTEPAIVLSWSEPSPPPSGALAGYRVFRAELETAEPGAAPDASKLKSPAELLGTAPSPEFRDEHFEFDRTYLYTVRAIAQVGPSPPGNTVESDDSAPAIVTPRDTFPPAAPVGLEATIVPAANQAPARVELSWAISPEPDLAGYRVYRSERDDTPGDRLNAEVLLSPTFRDDSVMPGRHYSYRVTAVDRAGNESPASPAVQIDIP